MFLVFFKQVWEYLFFSLSSSLNKLQHCLQNSNPSNFFLLFLTMFTKLQSLKILFHCVPTICLFYFFVDKFPFVVWCACSTITCFSSSFVLTLFRLFLVPTSMPSFVISSWRCKLFHHLFLQALFQTTFLNFKFVCLVNVSLSCLVFLLNFKLVKKIQE